MSNLILYIIPSKIYLQEVLVLQGAPSFQQTLAVLYPQVAHRFQVLLVFLVGLVLLALLFDQVDLGVQSIQVAHWVLLYLVSQGLLALLGALEFLYPQSVL